MHGLAGIGRRAPDVMPVRGRHLDQLAERPDLLGQLLAQADDLLGAESLVELGVLCALDGDQPVDAIERNAAVVADDAPAPVGVGQPGDEARAAGRADRRRVRVEHAVVVRLR